MKKVVFITGSSAGIGLVTANFLVEKGFKVYGFSRSLPKDEVGFITLIGDVTKEDTVLNALNEVIKKEGRLDVLINNAGMGIGGASEYTPKAQIEQIFNVNVIGLASTTNLALKHLRQSRGKIINIGSVAGELSIPFQSYYSASKASVQAFSLGLAAEVMPFGVSVSVVLPGDTKTAFTKNRQKQEVLESNVYKERVKKSLEVMERDEQNGMPAIFVSKVIYKLIKSKRPALIKTVGFKYKLFVFLKRLLPTRFVHFLIFKMYG